MPNKILAADAQSLQPKSAVIERELMVAVYLRLHALYFYPDPIHKSDRGHHTPLTFNPWHSGIVYHPADFSAACKTFSHIAL